MGISSFPKKISGWIKKYQYALLVLLAGLLLMGLPSGNKRREPPPVPKQEENSSLDQQLSRLLSEIDGAGRVKILLTVGEGRQTFYQEDSEVSGERSSAKAVILTDSNHNQTGMVRRVLSEKYRGAIVLCQGARQPSVRLAVIEAVSKVTGLSTDRICVLKMK